MRNGFLSVGLDQLWVSVPLDWIRIHNTDCHPSRTSCAIIIIIFNSVFNSWQFHTSLTRKIIEISIPVEYLFTIYKQCELSNFKRRFLAEMSSTSWLKYDTLTGPEVLGASQTMGSRQHKFYSNRKHIFRCACKPRNSPINPPRDTPLFSALHNSPLASQFFGDFIN